MDRLHTKWSQSPTTRDLYGTIGGIDVSEVVCGASARIDDDVILGYGETSNGVQIGPEAHIRSGTVVYDDVRIGARFRTGHNALVREATRIGDDVLLGTGSTIDGRCVVGSGVSIQSHVYVPTATEIGSNVFVGPGAVLTNDPYPIRRDEPLEGPILEDGVSIGANATILPGVTVGSDAFVAAGAIVTEDVPPERLAVGTPARIRPLPEKLASTNQIA